MSRKPLGIYIHIPFCVRKCNYCDFCSFSGVEADVRERYIERLLGEISSYKREPRLDIDTLFFGGGTPSLLSQDELSRILAALRTAFSFSPDTEFTLEVNPGTVSRDKLCTLKALGVNRLSFGLQSIHENELKKLGRIHSYAEFLQSYRDAREVGFDNISVDLMYGIPEQTPTSFEKTLSCVTALSPEHISVYSLIIEEGTPFYECRASLKLPDEDEDCGMYDSACKMLLECGYTHYEISNYARGELFSRHNLKYWQAEEYLGFGLSAHSYFEGKRFSNTESMSEYISGAPTENTGALSPEELEYEYAMLALRTSFGFSLDEYKKRFGKDFLFGREAAVKRFAELGLLTVKNGVIAFTERGFYISNTLLCELL